MSSSRPRRSRWTVSILIAAGLLAASGCGKKPPPTAPDYVLTQNDSEDVMQQIAMMISEDNGGWINELHVSIEAIPMFAPGGTPSGSTLPCLLDTSFTKAGILYKRLRHKYDNADTDPVCPIDSTAVGVEGVVDSAMGAINVSWTGGSFTGQYFHKASYFGSGLTSTVVSFVSPNTEALVDPDEIFHEDSLVATFTPLLRGGDPRYYITYNLVEYDGLILNRDPQNPVRYPLTGEVVMSLTIERTKDAGYTDIDESFEADVTLTFNGTDFVTATIADAIADNPPTYTYTINLKTGVFAGSP